MTTTAIPADLDADLFTGLCDDAAIFPPGNLPLEEAVPAHVAHRSGRHVAMVGPFVVALADLPELARLAADLPAGSLDLAVTVPAPSAVPDAVRAVEQIPAARLAMLEVAVPPGMAASAVVPSLAVSLGEPHDVTVHVEVPRDQRRDELLADLAESPYLAKFRTGGVRAELHPDERELAGAVLAAVRHRVPFKATAGLHHAIRHTDAATGFEMHGFLNLLVATDGALAGADEDEVVALLADRDPERVARRASAVSPRARAAFRSFGTCSIAEPVEELAGLGLLPTDLTEDLR